MGWHVPIIIGVIVGIVTFAAQGLFGGFGCKWENSECAESSALRNNTGLLFSYDGRPLRNTQFELWAGSLSGPGDEQPFPVFSTDARGRFCFVWVDEFANIVARHYDYSSDAPVDPRFAGREGRTRLRRIQHPEFASARPRRDVGFMAAPRDFRVVLHAGPIIPDIWNPKTDLAGSCQTTDVRPAWYRFNDLRSSWQHMLLLVLPLLSVALLVGALALGPAAALGRALAVGGCIGCLAGGTLFLLLWDIV